MANISATCPDCGKTGEVPEEWAGRGLKCSCGAAFTVGASHQEPSAHQPPTAPPPKHDPPRWPIVAAVGVLLMLILLLGFHVSANQRDTARTVTPSPAPTAAAPSRTYTSAPTPIAVTPPEPEETEAHFKASTDWISYDELARNTERHTGKRVVYKARVVQFMEGADTHGVRADITKGSYGLWDDTIYIEYPSHYGRLLDRDIVKVWGTIEGRFSYTAVMGNTITIPHVKARYLSIISKGGSR